MNRRLLVSLLIILITAWSFMGMPLDAYAHGEETTIELNVTQAQPGMSIEVHGSGFEAGDATTIMLMLVGSDRPQTLGTATADDKGELTQTVVLPADLMSGAYEIRVADDHHAATAELSIVTEAGDEEGGQRAEEEPLLAPMPEPAALTTSVNSARPPSAAPSSAAATPTISPVLLLSSGLALIVLIVGLIVISRRSQ